MMMPVKDWEADAQKRRSGVTFQEFSVSIADQEINRIGEQQGPHVPQILAGIDMAIGSER